MKRFAILTAAALAVGGFTVPATAQQEQQDQQRQTQREGIGIQAERDRDRVGVEVDRDRMDRVQAEQVDEGTANNIRGTIATATEAALTEGEFRSLTQRFTEQDQERLREFIDRGDFARLDQQIRQFNELWQQRYEEEFAIDDREQVLPDQFVQIYQGHIPEAQLAGERQPGAQLERRPQPRPAEPAQPAEPGSPGEPATPATPAQPGARQDQQPGQRVGQQDQQPGQRVGQQDQQPGQRVGQREREGVARDGERARMDENMATVHFQESHGLPDVTLHLVNEGTIMDAWRIDVPAQVDGQTIQQNLEQALNQAIQQLQQADARPGAPGQEPGAQQQPGQLGLQQEGLPQDQQEAQRYMSHLIMAAVVDADLEAQPAAFPDRPGVPERPGAPQQPGAQQEQEQPRQPATGY